MGQGSEGRIRAILFDLDGTLLETRSDIAAAANLALADHGLGPLPLDEVTRHVGRGSRVLVARCLEACGVADPESAEIEVTLTDFIRHYKDHILDTTEPYEGVGDMLDRLRQAGLAMGIVTNKPHVLALGAIDGLGLTRYFGVVLGGESLPVRKPHPAPLLHALRALDAGADESAMVGDMEIDVESGRAASMRTVGVTWGFSTRETLEASRPDFLADTPAQLADWILR